MFIKRFVRYKFFLVLAILFIVFVPSVFVYADTAAPSPSPDAAALSQRIQELQDKIQSLRSQENSLSSQIAVMDNEVKLSEYKISATKEQISQLSNDITV